MFVFIFTSGLTFQTACFTIAAIWMEERNKIIQHNNSQVMMFPYKQPNNLKS